MRVKEINTNVFPKHLQQMTAFFGTKYPKPPPPKKKMQTHKLIVPCAEVWNQCPKVLIWDKDAVYWRFWWDLVIHGAPHFETHPRQCDQNKSLFASLMITYTYIFYMVVEQQDSIGLSKCHKDGTEWIPLNFVLRSWLTNPTPKSSSSFNHVKYQLCRWDPWHEPCADLSFLRKNPPSDILIF